VLYGHTYDSLAAVVGYVPPDGWKLTDRELIARGSLDMSDPLAAKLHSLIRKGVLTWSIGFKGGPSRREGNTRVISAREILELSVVPVAANQRTRTLAIKANPQDLTEQEIRDWAAAAGVLPPPKPMSAAALEVERQRILRDLGMDEQTQREHQRLRKQADYLRMELALGEPLDAEEQRQREVQEQRRKADELALQVASGDFDLKLDGPGDTVSRPRERLSSGFGDGSVRDLMVEVLTGDFER
jgi:hypothetical protein